MCQVFGVVCGHRELIVAVRATAVAQTWVPRPVDLVHPTLGTHLYGTALRVCESKGG